MTLAYHFSSLKLKTVQTYDHKIVKLDIFFYFPVGKYHPLRTLQLNCLSSLDQEDNTNTKKETTVRKRKLKKKDGKGANKNDQRNLKTERNSKLNILDVQPVHVGVVY